MKPEQVAELGEKIYKEKYQQTLEAAYTGQFVAVDVKNELCSVDESPTGALQKAREKSPTGLFHLIKIGSKGAFRVSYSKHGHAPLDWILRR